MITLNAVVRKMFSPFTYFITVLLLNANTFMGIYVKCEGPKMPNYLWACIFPVVARREHILECSTFLEYVIVT